MLRLFRPVQVLLFLVSAASALEIRIPSNTSYEDLLYFEVVQQQKNRIAMGHLYSLSTAITAPIIFLDPKSLGYYLPASLTALGAVLFYVIPSEAEQKYAIFTSATRNLAPEDRNRAALVALNQLIDKDRLNRSIGDVVLGVLGISYISGGIGVASTYRPGPERNYLLASGIITGGSWLVYGVLDLIFQESNLLQIRRAIEKRDRDAKVSLGMAPLLGEPGASLSLSGRF